MISEFKQKPDSMENLAHILCVTPSRAEAMGLLGVFSGDGHDITWVPGPVQAIHQLQARHFDVILADIDSSCAQAVDLVEEARRVQPAVSWVLVNGTYRGLPFRQRPLRFERPLEPDHVRQAVADLIRKQRPRPRGGTHLIRKLAQHLSQAAKMLTTNPASVWEDPTDLTGRLQGATQGFLKLTQRLDRFVPVPDEQVRPIDVRTAIDDTVFLLGDAWGERVKFEMYLPPLPPVPARPSHLRHSLLTLLLHAAQGIPDQGRILIRGRAERDRVVITITDSGPGTPRAPADRIAYARALRAIVSLGGAVMTFDRAGIGSTFEIVLPRG